MHKEELRLDTPLPIEDIDFRVQSINNGGYATILAYKNARTDMQRLDDVCGAMYWQRKHEIIDGKLFCHIGIYNEKINQWIWKSDVGTESMTEKDKGLVSDSVKRACFNWGIGRELYNYPIMSIKLNENEWDKNGGRPKQTYNLKLKDWRWYSEFEDNKLTFIAAKDENGKLRFKWGEMKPKTEEPEFKQASPTIEVIETVEAEVVGEESISTEESDVQGFLKKPNESPIAPMVIEEPVVDSERAALAEEYRILFGRLPHGKAGKETIKADIEAFQNKETIGIDLSVENKVANNVEVDSPEADPYESVTNEPAIEEDEEELEFDIHPMQIEIDKMSYYTNAAEFIAWAKETVGNYVDTVDAEKIESFKTLCNAHYAKIK